MSVPSCSGRLQKRMPAFPSKKLLAHKVTVNRCIQESFHRKCNFRENSTLFAVCSTSGSPVSKITSKISSNKLIIHQLSSIKQSYRTDFEHRDASLKVPRPCFLISRLAGESLCWRSFPAKTPFAPMAHCLLSEVPWSFQLRYHAKVQRPRIAHKLL